MNVLLAGALSAGLGLALVAGAVSAQDAPIIISADGTNSGAGTGSISNNNGGDIYLGDITSGPEGTTIEISSSPGPEQASTASAAGANGRSRPAPSRPAPATAPDDGNAPVPSAGDRDGDNYPDDLEPAAGLDPTNPDTDEDGVADGDEVNVFGTDPLLYDTDGDGYGDGEELFWTESDPLDPENRSGITNAQRVDDRERRPSVVESEQTNDYPVPPPPVTSDGPAVGGIGGPVPGTSASGGSAAAIGDGDASAAPGDIASGVSDPAAILRGDDTSSAQCSAYGDWYEAQTNYEAAGGVDAADSLVEAVDPDRNGIACESMMESDA
jgi:hypothetical protein